MGTDVRSIVELLGTLTRRPRRGESPGGQLTRRGGLPMVCLVRDGKLRDDLRVELTRQLGSARPHGVPHAVWSAEPEPPAAAPRRGVRQPVTTDDIAPLRRILAALAEQLSKENAAVEGHLRFPRFGLVTWLMDQQPPRSAARPTQGGPVTGAERRDDDGTGEQRDGEPSAAGDGQPPAGAPPYRWLRARLREYDRRRYGRVADPAVVDVIPSSGWVGPVARLAVRISVPLWSTARSSGRIPLLSGRYRWFLRRQGYLQPRDPGTFLGFAERLTGKELARQDPEQVARLLVHAFLEDLRRAYGHRGWPWRLGGPRRTAYVTVVLDGISRSNRGYLLLRLINDVRTETAQFDPLLVIAVSEKVPPYARQAGAAEKNKSAPELYGEWRAAFVADSRAGKETAWYLGLRVSGPVGSGPATIDTGRPPWWSRRGVPVVLACALLAAALTPVVGWRDAHCGMGPSSAAALLRTAGTECIGVTDGSYPFAAGNGDLAAVEDTIRRQNADASRAHAAQPGRPYAQLVFLAALSSTSTPPDPLVSEREVLEGVAALQKRQLANRGAADPIIRVLVANGGDRMRYGRRAADIIRSMADADRSVVGVVGFDQSRTQVTDTVRSLNGVGLPMVAATLSDDRLPGASSLYFQVSPQNAREARVAAAFAPRLAADGSRQVRIVRADDPTDTYTRTLADDAVRSFRTAGYAVHRDDFPQRDPAGAGGRACGATGLVFYVGRPDGFAGFLRGVDQNCRSRPPAILASDDVSRYVADADQRTAYTSIPFSYLSFAVGSPTCDSAAGPGEDVYRTIKRLFRFECRPSGDRLGNDPSLDGHALLAYDATWALTVAVQNLAGAGIPVSAGAVWKELSTVRLDGQSGRIAFGEGPRPQVPPDKAIAILRVDGGSVRETPYRCGRLPGRIRPAAGCPADPR